jgi:signal transduction histidine kinase
MNSYEALVEENDFLKKEVEAFKKNERLFEALVQTTIGDVGEDFFNNIVIRLSEWLNVDCVMIGQLETQNIVECSPMYLDGEFVKNYTYKLKDTPCDLTTKKGYCAYIDNVRDTFPKAKDLKDMNARGYMGTALYNKKGQANGVLCVISRKKLELPPQCETIIRIVGSRITSEIERIKAVKALEVSEKNLKKAIASKDRLFSIISHDLRTPFNALIGFSKLLMTKIHDLDVEKTKKYIKIIHDVSSETYYLLTNLLDWTLTQTNEIKFNPSQYNLSELVNETVSTQRYFAQQKKIDLNVSVGENISIVVDHNMFSAILRNLISNSVKFTPQDGKISISATTDTKKTTIIVSDTGVGITAPDLKKLFKPEISFSSVGTDNEHGAGLGLNLCKELVKKHGGEIWVNSKTGKGSDFCFTIPNKVKLN